MIRLRRRNLGWLAVLAMLTIAGMVAAPVGAIQFVLLAIFALASVASVVEIGKERENIIDALRRAPIRQRVSPSAKEAMERARSRGGFVSNDLMVLDVGLIAVQSGVEGMAMRRTRSISKDDDGARPFVTLNVEASEAERNATIRFEIFNQHGDQKFVHEMKAYLREGEMNIMTDHHLPLAGNQDVAGAGDWDLRVYIDGNLAGMHNFMLAPSMNERHRRLAQERGEEFISEADYDIIDEVEQEVPPRLQDLLQNQAGNQENSRPTRSRTTESEPSRSRTRSRTANRRRR